jgi:hypothetical protein
MELVQQTSTGVSIVTQRYPPAPRPAFSIPSILAIIAAAISFKAGAVFGLIMAIVAILLGVLGMLLALSPRTRGGIVSVIGMLGGLFGIVAAAFKLLTGNW